MPEKETSKTKEKKEEIKICCLCKKEYTEYGNNPWPLAKIEVAGRCCDFCDATKVTPQRLILAGYPSQNAHNFGTWFYETIKQRRMSYPGTPTNLKNKPENKNEQNEN